MSYNKDLGSRSICHWRGIIPNRELDEWCKTD